MLDDFETKGITKENSDIYACWVDKWTKNRHEKILNFLESFADSGNYRLIAD